MSWINRDGSDGDRDGEKSYPLSKWMTWLFLVASILLLIYTYYRSEIIFQDALVHQYFKYYLISMAGILFWGVVLRLREEIRANIVTVVTSLVVGLYMIEGGLKLFDLGQTSNYIAIAATKMGVEFDKRERLEVIEELIAEGVDVVPAVRPRDVLNLDKELLPLGGVANRTTVGTNENGYYMIYPSDRYGFNNPDAEWDNEQVEWLLTGDSFTEGIAVHPGEDIAGQIRAVAHESVISLGRSGNGPLMELAEIIEYAEAVRPKKVLWVYFEENDLRGDIIRDQKIPLLMQYMEDGFSQNLINRQKEIDSRLLEFIELKKAEMQTDIQSQKYKTRWMRLFAIRNLIGFDVEVDIDHGEVDADDPIFANILTKAKTVVDAWGGALYFVYLPEYFRYSNLPVSHDHFRKKAKIINVVKGLNIPVVDIHQEVFADHPDPLALFPFRVNGHYNADGYAEVAKAIVDSVKEHESQNDK